MTRRPGRAGLGWWLALAIAVTLLVVRVSSLSGGLWSDLDVYAAAGHAVIVGRPVDQVVVDGLPFTYPPFAAVVFAPLSLLPAWSARALMTLASLGALGVTLAIIARRTRLAALPVVTVAVLAIASEPVVRTLILGQVNLVLLSLVVIDLVVMPQRMRGILTGLVTGVKLVPGAFVLLFLARRNWGAAGRWAAASAVTLLVGAVVQWDATRRFFGGSMWDLGLGSDVMGVDNQSLSGVWMRLTGHPEVDLPVTLGLVAIPLVIAVVLLVVAARIPGDDVRDLSIVAVAMLLASPVSWTHHWVWLLPTLVWLLARGRIGVVLVAGTTLWLGVPWLVSAEPAPPPGEWVTQAVAAAYVMVGVAVLLMLGADRVRSEATAASAIQR